jgi:Trp operon repressor
MHPEIYMSSVKEPRFFGLIGESPNFQGPGDYKVNQRLVTNFDTYQDLFRGTSSKHKAVGEGSTWYLYLERAPIQIHQYIPDVKLIAVLRNPVDRAFSNFLHQRYRSSEEAIANFSEALDQEEDRIQHNWRPFWHYKNLGFYYRQLSRYFEIFPRHQIKVYLSEDLKKNSKQVVTDVFHFLDVDSTFLPDLSRNFYQSYQSKNQLLNSMVMGDNLVKSLTKSLLPPHIKQLLGTRVRTFNRQFNTEPSQAKLSRDIRQELIEIYREDITKLERLIDRDLSHWLQGK